MSTITDRPAATATRKYANYWEDDSTADPKIVRVLHKESKDTYNVVLPDGTPREVHKHTLGKFHNQ